MTVVALRYVGADGKVAYGHGDLQGDHMVVGSFASEQDVGDVAAGQATILHNKPLGSLEQGDTVVHGWSD